MTANDILTLVRNGIGDYKAAYTRVIDEIVTSSYTETGGTGTVTYYTINLPIASNSSSDVYFKGGRWLYTVSDSGTDGTRWIQWISASGIFLLDSGATQVTAGDIVKIGYAWDEQLEYSFQDSDLLRYIQSACYWVNEETCNITSFTTTGSVDDGTLAIDPSPSQYLGMLISKVAQLSARLQLQSETDTSSIYVRQGQVTIDTTKGGRDRLQSIKDLRTEIHSMVLTILTADTSGQRIDLYSTYDASPYDQGYYQEKNTDVAEEYGEVG